MRSRAPKHSAVVHASFSSRLRSAFRLRNIAVSTAMLALATVLGLAATGGTYALWNTQAAVPASSISTGSTNLTIENQVDYIVPGLNSPKLYPGRSVITAVPLKFKNTGTTPLTFTIVAPVFATGTPTALSSKLAVALTKTTATATACVVSAAGVTPTSTTGAIRLEVGETVNMCLEVRLATDAPSSVQGNSALFTLNLDYVQVRP